MRKTLLLVFIHGFKGGDDTFGTFPEHLRALISHALPKINVVAIVYPRYETRGDLKECVARFREWLENKVIDLEVANDTLSPTVDPAVHTILVGHSMGGIVAAEALLLLANEQSSPVSTSKSASIKDGSKGVMFPHVQGLLAFDTPFLGLAPEMIAHGLEGGHKAASSAYNTYNEVASLFSWGGKDSTPVAPNTPNASAGALPAPTAADAADAAATPRWQSWGKYAMFAGAAGAVAAGGAAALYSQREKISAGWTWAGSHLLFVGDLAKAERLRQRVDNLNKQCTKRGIGAAILYTNLGKGAREGYGLTETLSGRDRTFCNLPTAVKEGRSSAQSKPGLHWIKAINEKAKDETTAHTTMFYPKENPGFYSLGEASKEIVASWVDQSWYKSSSGPENADKMNEILNPGSIGKDWEGVNKTSLNGEDDESLQMRDEEEDGPADVGRDMLEGSILIDKSPSNSTTLKANDANKVPLPKPNKQGL